MPGEPSLPRRSLGDFMNQETLPKGLRLDRGYLQIRLFSDGRTYYQNFGPDNIEAREIAIARLNELRKQLLLWKSKLIPKHPFEKEIKIQHKKFHEVSKLFLSLWSNETDADGQTRHTPEAIRVCEGIIARLDLYFGKKVYDAIKPIHVQKWRDKRLQSVIGTSVNREQNVLSSIFSHVEAWIKLEKIDAFVTPAENPCNHVEKAKLRKRERIVTPYEVAKLKNAARELGDHNGCENISLAVKTTLSDKDLKTLKFGDTVDLDRAKTGVPVLIPIAVTHSPDWTKWRRRWDAIRIKAGLRDIEWRDLRKAGGNMMLGRHDPKLISMYMGHADLKTTEEIYFKLRSDKMQALAKDLSDMVDKL